VTFESGSRLSRIENGALEKMALKSVALPFDAEIGTSPNAFPNGTEVVFGQPCETVPIQSIGRPSQNKPYRLSEEKVVGKTEIRGPIEIIVPPCVEEFGKEALARQSVKFVTFEDGSQLQTIGGSAFWGCPFLKGIIFPPSVEVLEEKAFFQCRSLSSVGFESGSKPSRIGRSAFSQTGLVEIVLPSTTKVASGALSNGVTVSTLRPS
jgi:hypothetical protein